MPPAVPTELIELMVGATTKGQPREEVGERGKEKRLERETKREKHTLVGEEILCRLPSHAHGYC